MNLQPYFLDTTFTSTRIEKRSSLGGMNFGTLLRLSEIWNGLPYLPVTIPEFHDNQTWNLQILPSTFFLFRGGVFQLQWYVGKEGILTKPSTYLEYNSQQLSIKNVQFHHEAVYYGEQFVKIFDYFRLIIKKHKF